MRSITGNGSVRTGGIYKPLIYFIKGEPSYIEEPAEPVIRKKITVHTFFEPLQLLIQKDILLNLIFGGVVYTIWSMVTSSTTSLFKASFNLNELTLGLAFLPNGTQPSHTCPLFSVTNKPQALAPSWGQPLLEG